jgi:hypothetical protein
MGICFDENTKVLSDKLEWRKIIDLNIGDKIVATDENFIIGNHSPRKMRVAIVRNKIEIFDKAIKLNMADGRKLVLTPEHKMLCKVRGSVHTQWRKAKDIRLNDEIRFITELWNEPNYEDGWISGIIDGEGCLRIKKIAGVELTISQIDGFVWNKILKYFKVNNYSYRVETDKRIPRDSSKLGNKPVNKIVIGKADEIFKIIGKTRPSRFIDKTWWIGKKLPNNGWLKVNNIELLPKQKMIDLQTSEKTFIAEGFVSHNSTIIEAIIYAFVSRMSGVNACVVADDLDGANYIFEMQKLFQEKLENHLKPRPKHSNEKKLAFQGLNSQIVIDTAENPNVGRKYTFQFAHLTEVGRWQKSLNELLTGLGHAIPNAMGTMVFLESTAKGYNEFYDLWVKAINGGTDWVPIFLPWWEFPEYALPLENGQFYPIENIKFVTPVEKENFLKEEREIKQKYNLSDEQLNWRRWDIVNNCSGDINKFNQENPDCWQTAFVASGDIYFNREALQAQEIRKPLAVGNIVKEESRWIFRQDAAGLFRIYEYPQRGEQYAIGADSAEGLEHGDKSAGVVINKRTNKTACIYNHNIPPDRFEEDLIKAGNFYNEAVIACENQGYGYSINQGLYKRYGKVYRRIKTKKGFAEPTLELGWNTNSVTRPQMLAQLNEEIANNSTDLLDTDLIGQCWTFVNNPKRGQPEAEKGKCDDLVIARSIAGQVRSEQPYREKVPIVKKRRHFRGLSGY